MGVVAGDAAFGQFLFKGSGQVSVLFRRGLFKLSRCLPDLVGMLLP